MKKFLRFAVVCVFCAGLTVSLVPRQSEAWIFGFFVRGMFGNVARGAAGGIARGAARQGFRQLARNGGRRLIQQRSRAALTQASKRRVPIHQGQARMQNLFGHKPYVLRNPAGKAVWRAEVQGDRLVFFEAGKKAGFAQWESNGLMLYRRDGVKLARLQTEDNRLLAYDTAEKYLGQFIKEMVKDEIKQYFVDAMGKRHAYMPVPQVRAAPVAEAERLYAYDENGEQTGFSYFENGILVVCDAQGIVLAKVVKEEERLMVYDADGEQQGYFIQRDAQISAYDMDDKLVGTIVTHGEKAMFLFAG